MTAIRRFLLAPSFARLVRKERGSARVTEGYFATQSGRNSHVLLESGQCHLVLVNADEGGAGSEERTEVPRAHADALLDVCAGRAVYERTRLSIGAGGEALIDRITQPGPLDIVSVEFATRDDATTFLAPLWFGPEVTGDAQFDRRAIALQGVPATGELPLSNAALEALLDAIEDRLGRPRFAATPPRRATNDSSVIDALRRLASPDQATVEPPPQAELPAAPADEAPPAAGEEAGSPDGRMDDVIASLSQALGNQGTAAENETVVMPNVERPATRLRRFGS